MILRRYLTKEVVLTTLATLMFLLLLTVGGRLVRFVGVAAQSGMDLSVVFWLIVYRLPSFLVLILPLSLFIGLMLVLGRWYVDHEMSIVRSAGVSSRVLGLMLWPIIAVFLALELFLSLYLTPLANLKSEVFEREQALKSAFELIRPGSFVNFDEYSLYVKGIDLENRNLEGVVLVQNRSLADSSATNVIVTAARAEQAGFEAAGNQLSADPESDSGAALINLYDGKRYEVQAGSLVATQVGFESYRIRIESPSQKLDQELDVENKSSLQLVSELSDPESKAELWFRVSLGALVLLAWVLAVPLSKVNPRQGRWLRLLPAVLLFASSLLALMTVYESVASGSVWSVSYLGVVLLYLGVAVFVYNKNQLKNKVLRLGSS